MELILSDEVTRGIYLYLENEFVRWFLYFSEGYRAEFFKFPRDFGDDGYYSDDFDGMDTDKLRTICEGIIVRKIESACFNLVGLTFVSNLDIQFDRDYLDCNKEIITLFLKIIFSEFCFGLYSRKTCDIGQV